MTESYALTLKDLPWVKKGTKLRLLWEEYEYDCDVFNEDWVLEYYARANPDFFKIVEVKEEKKKTIFDSNVWDKYYYLNSINTITSYAILYPHKLTEDVIYHYFPTEKEAKIQQALRVLSCRLDKPTYKVGNEYYSVHIPNRSILYLEPVFNTLNSAWFLFNSKQDMEKYREHIDILINN